MSERTATVASRVGLHARPAAIFAEAAGEYENLEITIRAEGEDAEEGMDASSVLSLMSLGASHGDKVVLAAEGYPASPRSGDVITGADVDGVLHAGTARNSDGELVSAGGRVLSIVGTGPDLVAAREEAYGILRGITMAGGHYRSDIAGPAVEGRIRI